MIILLLLLFFSPISFCSVSFFFFCFVWLWLFAFWRFKTLVYFAHAHTHTLLLFCVPTFGPFWTLNLTWQAFNEGKLMGAECRCQSQWNWSERQDARCIITIKIELREKKTLKNCILIRRRFNFYCYRHVRHNHLRSICRYIYHVQNHFVCHIFAPITDPRDLATASMNGSQWQKPSEQASWTAMQHCVVCICWRVLFPITSTISCCFSCFWQFTSWPWMRCRSVREHIHTESNEKKIPKQMLVNNDRWPMAIGCLFGRSESVSTPIV